MVGKVIARTSLLPLTCLLMAADAPSPAETCRVEYGVADIWGKPLLLEKLSVAPVPLAPDAILAAEVVQIAPKMWRTTQDLRLPGYDFTYPANVRVTALRSSRGDERCLRDAVPAGQGPDRGEIIPCLLDKNGDELFERVEIYTQNAIVPWVGQKPQFKARRVFELPAPIRLVEDPQGVGHSRTRLHRRLRIVSLADNTLNIVSEHAIQNASAMISYSLSGKSAAPKPLGSVTFKAGKAQRSLQLTDGAVEKIGGVRFQVARSASGWTMTPLDQQFPDWVRYDCGGTHVKIEANAR